MSNNRSLFSKRHDVSNISAALRQEMFELYDAYYDATSEDLFFGDLQAKDYAICLYDEEGALRGFTTVKVGKQNFEGEEIVTLFSGDTIIHHHFWGQPTLYLAWFEEAGKIKAENPDLKMYWVLIVKGQRTYRILKRFMNTYYPNRKASMPTVEKRLMDFLYSEKFGQFYDAESGLIKFESSLGQLKSKWANAEERSEGDPETAFFLAKNPEYANGVELACLADLSEENLEGFALDGFRNGLNG